MPKTKINKKTVSILIRLTPDEKDYIEAKADAEHLMASSYARRELLRGKNKKSESTE